MIVIDQCLEKYNKLTRLVKMDQNLWANPAHHGFGSSWVEIFSQILVRVHF